MKEEYKILINEAIKRVIKSVRLVKSSLENLAPYDPSKEYTDKELESYDALTSRFERAYEISIKFFRIYEKYQFAESSDTIRDLLNRMEKLRLITSAEQWIEMRDLRNRIVHDYLPSEIKKAYDLIMFDYAKELKSSEEKIKKLEIK